MDEKILFIQRGSKVEVRRGSPRGKCICLFTDNLDGCYGIHMQTHEITPNELRQIADKLESLNS